jgi:hypothetical protein
MFRTIKLKLPYDPSILETGKRFMEACQIFLNYGFSEHIFSKYKLNKATYSDVRGTMPALPSAHVQTARNTTSESLKQTKLEKERNRKSLTRRYDRITLKFYPDSHTISLTTVRGSIYMRIFI